MDVKILEISESSPLLRDVIDLADANRKTLGFLPPSVFEQAAAKGNILVAVDSKGDCVGYLLYRIVKTKSRAAITHLCVAAQHRRKGIGRRLVNQLIATTKNLLGISLFSRRDYESNSLWPQLDFQYTGEKAGRGKDRVPLSHYWYAHDHPSLLTLMGEAEIQAKKVHAVIDHNIFVYMFEDPDYPLSADWLVDDLALCVTSELYNEIERDDQRDRRHEMLQYAEAFTMVRGKHKQVRRIEKYLEPCFPENVSEQDRSDRKHLAHAIAVEADFFVTNDRHLRNNLGSIVNDEFDLKIVAPQDLIIHLDELMQEADYQPRRLAGTPIRIDRVSTGESDALAEIFHRQSGERKGQFRMTLNHYLSHPKEYDTYAIGQHNSAPLAVVVLTNKDSAELEVPFLRSVEGPLSPALESKLLFWTTNQSIVRNAELVRITEDYLPDEMVKALRENSYTSSPNGWIKFNITGVRPVSDVVTVLDNYQVNHGSDQSILEDIKTNLVHAQKKNDIPLIIELEKALWPLKLLDVEIPAYIVPIRPPWAADLFDDALGRQTLFGSDTSLMLKMENVYYRSARTKLPTAPSRIVWYVSRGSSGQHYNVMAARASGYVEETEVGLPKQVFKRFSKLGVYRWQHVLSAANEDLEREVLAFRFGRVEVFDSPVPLSALMKIMNRRSAPQAPWPLTNKMFAEIYEKGTATY